MVKDQKQKSIALEEVLIGEKIEELTALMDVLDTCEPFELDEMVDVATELIQAITVYRFLKYTVPGDFTISKVGS